MAVKTSEELKNEFAEGKFVSEYGFSNLIDSCINDLKKLINVRVKIDVDYTHTHQGYEDDHEWAIFCHYYEDEYSEEDAEILANEEEHDFMQKMADSSILIITNEKITPFYIKMVNYDNGIYYPPYPVINQFHYSGRKITLKEFVIPPCGSIAFVKVGTHHRDTGLGSIIWETPTFSAVAMAIQGQIS